MPGPVVKVGVLVSVAAARVGTRSSAQAIGSCPNGFLGYCSPKNWSKAMPGNGSVKFLNSPNSVFLTSTDNDGKSKNSFVTMQLKALFDGVVSFDYKYFTKDKDGSKFDPFGYMLNGKFSPLVSPPFVKKGVLVADSFSFDVKAHDTFGFYAESLDSIKGPSVSKVFNFSYVPAAVPATAPVDVPGPVPFLGAAAAFGFSRRLKAGIRERG